MTESDPTLAPVIPIFGSRGSDSSPSGTPSRAHPAYRSLYADEDPYPENDSLENVGLEVEDSPGETLSARDAAVRALGRRDVSQRELERFLRDKGFEESVVVSVAQDMRDRGYQDDRSSAQRLVTRLQERKGLGRTAVAAELARRMFSPTAIAEALEVVDSSDEFIRAREIALKRAAQLRGLDRDTAVRRLSGYLQRRGYSGSTVRSAVDEAFPRAGTFSGSGPRFQ